MAIATALSVTPAQATSASRTMSPEQRCVPSPPVAGWRPARMTCPPMVTSQLTVPGTRVAVAREVTRALAGSWR